MCFSLLPPDNTFNYLQDAFIAFGIVGNGEVESLQEKGCKLCGDAVPFYRRVLEFDLCWREMAPSSVGMEIQLFGIDNVSGDILILSTPNLQLLCEVVQYKIP